MRKTQGLKLVIILYFIILFLSPAIYLSVCNIFEAGVQSAIVTWAIAYILDSIALGCLFKFKFDLDIFEIAYIIILNFFPFLFFYHNYARIPQLCDKPRISNLLYT